MLNLLKWHNNLTCTDNDLKSAEDDINCVTCKRHDRMTAITNDANNAHQSQNARCTNAKAHTIHRCLQARLRVFFFSSVATRSLFALCGASRLSRVSIFIFYLHLQLSVNSKLKAILLNERTSLRIMSNSPRNLHSNSSRILMRINIALLFLTHFCILLHRCGHRESRKTRDSRNAVSNEINSSFQRHEKSE